jgi:hypothetical protein
MIINKLDSISEEMRAVIMELEMSGYLICARDVLSALQKIKVVRVAMEQRYGNSSECGLREMSNEGR